MLSLIKMDFISIKKAYSTFILATIALIILGNIFKITNILNVVKTVYPLLCMTTYLVIFQYEQVQGHNKIAYSLPIIRDKIVLARYLEILFIALFAAVTTSLLFHYPMISLKGIKLMGLLFSGIGLWATTYLLIYYLTNRVGVGVFAVIIVPVLVAKLIGADRMITFIESNYAYLYLLLSLGIYSIIAIKISQLFVKRRVY